MWYCYKALYRRYFPNISSYKVFATCLVVIFKKNPSNDHNCHVSSFTIMSTHIEIYRVWRMFFFSSQQILQILFSIQGKGHISVCGVVLCGQWTSHSNFQSKKKWTKSILQITDRRTVQGSPVVVSICESWK